MVSHYSLFLNYLQHVPLGHPNDFDIDTLNEDETLYRIEKRLIKKYMDSSLYGNSGRLIHMYRLKLLLVQIEIARRIGDINRQNSLLSELYCSC